MVKLRKKYDDKANSTYEKKEYKKKMENFNKHSVITTIIYF